MKKLFALLVILIVVFIPPPYEAHAQSGQKTGTIADYAGTWILKDMTAENTY